VSGESRRAADETLEAAAVAKPIPSADVPAPDAQTVIALSAAGWIAPLPADHFTPAFYCERASSGGGIDCGDEFSKIAGSAHEPGRGC
jgi:hypothetical protein